jgi:hypothetical protein
VSSDELRRQAASYVVAAVPCPEPSCGGLRGELCLDDAGRPQGAVHEARAWTAHTAALDELRRPVLDD